MNKESIKTEEAIKADSMMSYELETGRGKRDGPEQTILSSAKEFAAYIKGDGFKLFIAFVLILINSAANIITPFLIARALDVYIAHGDKAGLGMLLVQLGSLYLVTVVAGYSQQMLIGTISQRTLFRLRAALFGKLQELPIAFFNQNKAGDLMSRLNNDTDKLNQFLSQSFPQFIGNIFSIIGIAIIVLVINVKLGLVLLSVTIFLFIVTKALTPWIERQNKKNLMTVGNLSASLQENLTNFRVIVAYSKRDYLRTHLEDMNKTTFEAARRAGSANKIFEPIYDFAGSVALLAVLAYGIHLISIGQLTLGLLVAFLAYADKFYSPLRYMANIFGTIQISAAAWSRIREIFSMKNNLRLTAGELAAGEGIKHGKIIPTPDLRMELNDVSFGYEGGGMVIENANLKFEAGKTYALVGPTGGGKSTLASIMAHLYDPLSGAVFLDGKDICSYSHDERAKAISVILQDPILFTGSVADNIRYGNDALREVDDKDLKKILDMKGFGEVVERFDGGLQASVSQASGGGMSIGQKQLISFMRAILREPKLLILDEATANIDTVTEAILNKTLEALPKDTTKVIIAHRLNTIKDADEIMFVNGHHVTLAGSFDDAISLIENSKRNS